VRKQEEILTEEKASCKLSARLLKKKEEKLRIVISMVSNYFPDLRAYKK